jgi:hypothetical protein
MKQTSTEICFTATSLKEGGLSPQVLVSAQVSTFVESNASSHSMICPLSSPKIDGWPISDCTSEGLKAVLCLLRTKCIQDGLNDKSIVGISEQRLHKAINVLLTYQNEDGGK